MDPLHAIYAFMTALVVSALATPAAARLALRLGAVDQPRERGLSSIQTPRLGGIGIVVGDDPNSLMVDHRLRVADSLRCRDDRAGQILLPPARKVSGSAARGSDSGRWMPRASSRVVAAKKTGGRALARWPNREQKPKASDRLELTLQFNIVDSVAVQLNRSYFD